MAAGSSKAVQRVMSLKDMVSPALRNITKNQQKFGQETKKSERQANSLWRSVKDGAGQTVKATLSMKNAIIGVGAAIAGLKAVDWAKDQAKSAIEGAAELESYRLTLDTVMKDTKKAAQTMKWASQFANITPFETNDVIEATVRLQSYGIAAQDTMGSIGDMAAVMNKDLMQAVEAVADAQTGELERMKEFGITKSMIQKKADKMFRNQTIINSKGQIVDQKKFNQALFALMDERFKGGMEKQSKTYKGLMSTITGTYKTGMAEIVGISADGTIRTGSLFDKLKKRVSDLADRFQKWSDDGTITKIATKFDGMVSRFEKKLPAIKQFFIDLKPTIKVASDIIGEIGKGLKAIVDFTKDHPDIAKAIGLTAVGAVVAKKTGLLSLGKSIAKTVAGNTVGTQSIKAGVVNVYGAKVNSLGGSKTPNIPDAGGSLPPRSQTHGTRGKAGKLAKILPFGSSLAKEVLSTKSLMMAAAIDAYSGTSNGPMESFQDFMYRDMKNSGMKNLNNPALGRINLNLPVSKSGYSTSQYGAFPNLLQELNRLTSAIAEREKSPSQVSVNLNGLTVKEEVDVDNLLMKIVKELKQQLGMVTTSVTTFSGYSPARR